MGWRRSTILYVSETQKEVVAFKICYKLWHVLGALSAKESLQWCLLNWCFFFESIAIRIAVYMWSFEEVTVFCSSHAWLLLEHFGVMQKIACGPLKLGHMNELSWISQFAATLWLCLSGCVIKLLSVLSIFEHAKRVYLPHSLLCTKLIHMAGNFLVLRPLFDPAAMEKAILSPADQGCLHSGTGN